MAYRVGRTKRKSAVLHRGRVGVIKTSNKTRTRTHSFGRTSQRSGVLHRRRFGVRRGYHGRFS